ncbi:MAG: glycosyltransferase family 39 protein [Patescibacteria group bacterium]
MVLNFLKKHKEILSLLVLAAIFFVVYLFLYWDVFRVGFNPPATEPPRLIFNQPDESVNYFFIKQLVLENRFSFPESLSDLALSQVHPRSTTVINGGIVPIGFPGFIILLSLILKVLIVMAGSVGFNLMAVMITPLIGVIAPFFLYGFLRRLFDQRLAWLSAVLMFILPPWWYYASRPFQHNVLFVFFVILTLYFSAVFYEKREATNKYGTAFLMGLFFGLAIYVRPSEMIWLTIILASLLILRRRYWRGREYLALAGALVLTAILFFATQTAFYGHPLASGYVRPDVSGAGGLITSGPQGIPILKAILVPFGFHPRVILHNLRGNFAHLFGFWSFLMLAGLVYWIFDIIKTRRRIPDSSFLIHYSSLFIFVSIYLLTYYGSWLFYDNLNQQFSIGSSHVRYFLPIFVLALPLVAGFLLWLWGRGPIVKSAVAILFLVMSTTAYLSVFAQFEGLSTVKNTVKAYQIWQERVYSLTEKDAVILTRYADKYIFPGRRVIVGWDNTERKQAIVNIIKDNKAVYYYDFKLTQAVGGEINNFLSAAEARLGPPLENWNDLELRKVLPQK